MMNLRKSLVMKTAAITVLTIAIGLFPWNETGRALADAQNGSGQNFDAADRLLGFPPDWHPKKHLLRKFCFGLCPDGERE
jgi:hypothetical protein